jgi:hypothetical protein
VVLFTDENSAPTAGFAKVRYVNLLPGSAPVDAYLTLSDGTTASAATGIAYKASSGYTAPDASVPYTLSFKTSGGASTIASLPNVQLVAGAGYTLYLMGPVDAPQAVLTRDR